VPSDAVTYVSGSTRFPEAATSLAMVAEAAANTIRIERFGPTG
jgi:hypothetical protein